MMPKTRKALAALLLSVTALPLAAQDGGSLFQAKPTAGAGSTGSAAASLFPQGDLEAAADISVGIEAPSPEPAPAESATTETAVPDAAGQNASEPPIDTTATVAPTAETAAAALALDTRPPETEEPQPQQAAEIGSPEALRTAAAATQGIRPRLRPSVLEPSPEPAAQSCVDPGAVRDRDIARNIGFFQVNSGLCITEEFVAEHGRKWHMVVISNRKAARGPVWAILHDNENSAFDAALYSVAKYGGKMIALETGESRSFSRQDPNRNFGATRNITAPCRNMVNAPAPAFTEAISRHFDPKYPVLTMHSNENGHVGNGGAGHISANRSSATMKGIMTRSPRGTLSDEDNAVLTAGTTPFESNAKAQKLASYLDGMGINMIYEHVRTNTNDCSFSFHVKLNNLGDYYNIEVEHGRTEDQKEILDALMAYLGVKPRR